MGTNADGDSTSSSGSSTGAPIDVPVCDFPATFEGSVEVCDPFETCTATVDPPGCGDHPDFRIVIDGDTGQGSIFAIGWDLLSVSTGASPLGGEVCCLPPDTNIEVLVTNGIAQYQLELSFSSAGAVTLLSFTVYEG